MVGRRRERRMALHLSYITVSKWVPNNHLPHTARGPLFWPLNLTKLKTTETKNNKGYIAKAENIPLSPTHKPVHPGQKCNIQ